MSLADVRSALAQRVRPVTLKMEIQDAAGTWIDMASRVGENRLLSVGSGLVAAMDRETGGVTVSLSSITVWNGDRFWDQPPPPNELFVAPSFPSSRTWNNLRVRFTIVTQGGAQLLRTLVIQKVTTKASSSSATITLRSLESILVDAQADRVRQGKQFWINQPVGFLVRRLLETRHTVAEVASFPDIQTSYHIPLAPPNDADPVVSDYARPPETNRTYEIYGNPLACNNDAVDAGYGDLWFGLEEELWKFDPETGDWTYWSALPAVLVALGYKIHHVYVSTLRQKVVAVAWAPDLPTADGPANRTGTTRPGVHNNVAVLTASMTVAPVAMTESVYVQDDWYTGMFSIRAGETVPGTVPVTIIGAAQGSTDAECHGMNLPISFAHWRQVRNADGRGVRQKTGWDSKLLAADDGNLLSATDTAFWQTELPGYQERANLATLLHGVSYPFDYRFSIGQYAGAFAFNEATDELVLTDVAWDAGLARYKFSLWTYNIQSAGYTHSAYYVMSGDDHFAPTSMQFNPAGTKLLVTGHVFSEAAWSAGAPLDTGLVEPCGAAVIEFDWPLAAGAYAGQPAQTLHFMSTNFTAGDAQHRRRWIPIDARYGYAGAGTRYVALSVFDYSQLTGSPWGACMLQLGSGGTVSPPMWSTGRQSGVCLWSDRALMIWHDAGTNQLRSLPYNSVAFAPAVVSDGIAPVDGDQGLSAGLVESKGFNADGNGGIFGISAPGIVAEADPDVMNPPQSGKFYLWQLAFTITDRVELADFSGTNVWEALKRLAAIANFRYGYDEVGRFYFKQRTPATSALGLIKATPNVMAGEIQASDVTHDWGYDEIFNYVELPPSRVVLSLPTGSVNMLARPDGWTRDPWNGEVGVLQKSLTAHKVTLRCVEGGVLGDEDKGVISQDRHGNQVVLSAPGGGQVRSRCRFAWLIDDNVIESQLLEPFSPFAPVTPPPHVAARVDVKNFNGLGQTVSNPVYDAVRGKVHVAWAGRGGSGSSSIHNREVVFCSIDVATGVPGTPVIVEPDQAGNDLDGIALALLSDGTLVCAYGTFGVRAKESTDGGLTWPTSTTVDGAFGGSSRGLCGIITDDAGTILQVITQMHGGGADLNKVYMRQRTGSGTYGTQVLIHTPTAGFFYFGSGCPNSVGPIGHIVDANTAWLVGDYSNASAQIDQVRALVTTNAWAASSAVLVRDYTGASVIRHPIAVANPVTARAQAMWITGGDPQFAHSDDAGATWTFDGAPAALAAVPFSVGFNRCLATAQDGSLIVGSFDNTVGGNLKHNMFVGDQDAATWTQYQLTGLANAASSTDAGMAIVAGQDTFYIYTRNNSSVSEVWVLVDRGISPDLSSEQITIPYMHGLDTERGTDPNSAIPVVSGADYGDQVEIGDFVSTVKDIVQKPLEGKTVITLRDAPTSGWPIGTRVIVRSWDEQVWSNGDLGMARTADLGATPAADGVVSTYHAISTRNFQPGAVARMAVPSSPVGDPEHLITAVLDGTTWDGRRVGSGGDTEVIPRYGPIRGYLAPVIDPTEFPRGFVFWIADTGIGITFAVPDPAGLGFNGTNVQETPFMVGDEIDIDAKGLAIDSQSLSKIIAVNNESVDKFKVQVFKSSRPTQFISTSRAREIARGIVNDRGFPHHILTVEAPLTFIPAMDDCYVVEDKRVLPWSATKNAQGDTVPVSPDTARAIAFVVYGYTLDPMAGRLTVQLRAVNPHKY